MTFLSIHSLIYYLFAFILLNCEPIGNFNLINGMRKILILLFSFCLTTGFSYAKDIYMVKPYNKEVNITPRPLFLKQVAQSDYLLTEKTTFVLGDESLEPVYNYFNRKIKQSTGFELKSKFAKKAESDFIMLVLSSDVEANDEGYLLESSNKGVIIKAKTPQGVFYGMQTLFQLLPAEIESSERVDAMVWSIPSVKIKDEPRFQYRGKHMDVCRHFLTVDEIKKQLDIMAMYKLNKFHWHLTEDQGWRIESKKFPLLNTISSTRIEGDGKEYGPFYYTQEEIKDVIRYAKERFIEVIPEVEFPGHAVAVLAAYPQYSCNGTPLKVRNIWGISRDIYCAGNEETFKFAEELLDEIIPLFESEYFHIGGDEAPKTRWQSCPKCQAKITELGLKKDDKFSAEEKLQSYFIHRIEAVLTKHHKKMIGWDEILEGGLAPSATVMSWRGEKGGIAAANMGHDVIMTPGKWLYLDHYQGDPKVAPYPAIGGYNTLDSTYSYDPVPKEIDASKAHHILGAQANVWMEYLPTHEIMEWRTYPRLIALAEVGWTAKKNKNYKDFERRIANQLVRLDGHHVNYYIPQPEQMTPSCNFVAFVDSAKLEFKSTRPVRMVYTTDGAEPTNMSHEYIKPLVFKENTVLKIRSVLVSGKMGDTRTILVEKQKYAPSVVKPADSRLKVEYYKGLVTESENLKNREADEVDYIQAPQEAKYRIPGYREYSDDELYNTVMTGYVNIPEDGIYYFSTNVEEFWLQDKLFISNHGQLKRYSTNDKSIALKAGFHPIKIVHLCNIIDGWPPMWDIITVSIRNEKDSNFKIMDSNYFK